MDFDISCQTFGSEPDLSKSGPGPISSILTVFGVFSVLRGLGRQNRYFGGPGYPKIHVFGVIFDPFLGQNGTPFWGGLMPKKGYIWAKRGSQNGPKNGS